MHPDIKAHADVSGTIRIGILAHKGTDICREMWQPTTIYLEKALPGRHFELLPLNFDEIEPAVETKSIDFLICNPAIYVDLEVKYGVTRMMTLRNLVEKQITTEFGGVVFCRADRTDLKSLKDFRGKRFSAVTSTSFGGWDIALREFKQAGFAPEKDFAEVIFLDNHPAVVRSVLSGKADIGTVRTDTIERMAAGGEIRMDEIRAIRVNPASVSRSHFPYLLSTRLYPEWPFAKLADTNDELSREVTVALLTLPVDSPAAIAAQIGGWSICLDYTSVHDCLRELKAPPYEHYGQISRLDLLKQYWQWLLSTAILIAALLGVLILLRGRHLEVGRISSRLRMLFASAGEGICAVDLNGLTTFANPAAGLILGYSEAELLGNNLHRLTHYKKPDGSPYPENECPIILACKEGAVHQGSEEFFYHKDGIAIPVSYSSRPLWVDGNIGGAVICFRDISKRKQAEKTLQEREQLLSSIFMASPIGIGVVQNRIIVAANDRLCKMTGYSREEMIGKNARILYANDEQFNQVGAEKYRQIEQWGIGTVETSWQCKDGRIINILLSSAPVDKKNLSDGVTFTALDITDRNKSEAALRRSEANLAKSQEIAHVGSWNHDLIADRLSWSDEVFRIFGTDPESFSATYQSFLEFVHPEDRPVVDAAYANSIREGSDTYEIEHRIVRQTTGEIRHVLEKCEHVRDASGKTVQSIGVVQDITDRKRAEIEKDLLQAQLLHVQKMESIGTLAGGIAHDLNNILFPITGLTEMLLGEIPAEDHAHAKLKQIYKSALRGSDLVKQILAFSRQSNPKKLPIRIQPILKEVLNLVRATIPMNFEISSQIDTHCGMVSADPTQVHQILMNLITNAYHAVEVNGGRIHVGLETRQLETGPLAVQGLASGNYACIVVSDTGTGMDSALLDKIFTPYFTTKQQGKGTGLGLSVVHGIVKEHGGDVQISSEIGKGTVFRVFLPLLKDAPEKADKSLSMRYPTGNERILLVDDEAPIVQLEQMMLERLGYRVTTRTGSLDALTAFRADPRNFDLVISDRGMPNMTGEQLSRELISIKPGIPIILCTGFSDEDDELRACKMGIKGFLKKPVAMGDLAETVRKVLDENK